MRCQNLFIPIIFVVFALAACSGDSGTNSKNDDPLSASSSSTEVEINSSATLQLSSSMGISSSSAFSSSSSGESSSSGASSFDWNACVSAGNCGTFTDVRDEQAYKYTTIGTQIWMAQNLNYDTANGVGSWCYRTVTEYCDTYGRLYNWTTAMADSASSATNPSGVQGVCPAGWHLPSDAEWTLLTTYVDANNGLDSAGNSLKATSGWSTHPGITNTDLFGFTAIPAGYSDGSSFFNMYYDGLWWSSTELTSEFAYYRYVYNDVADVYSGNYTKTYAFSVRCVKDPL
jgi:uncharacterized protein (TIGR02145 family)